MLLKAKNEVYMPFLGRPFLRNGNNDPIHMCSLSKNFPSRKVINNFLFTMHISGGQPVGTGPLTGTKSTQLGCLCPCLIGRHSSGSHSSQEPKQILNKIQIGFTGVKGSLTQYLALFMHVYLNRDVYFLNSFKSDQLTVVRMVIISFKILSDTKYKQLNERWQKSMSWIFSNKGHNLFRFVQ